MKKPKEAIERMRKDLRGNSMSSCEEDCRTILAWADSIPADAVPVVWPADLTRERLEELADKIGPRNENAWECWPGQESALRALAAIAPVRKKRVANLWERIRNDQYRGDLRIAPTDEEWDSSTWKLVARNVELED